MNQAELVKSKLTPQEQDLNMGRRERRHASTQDEG